MTPEGKLPAGSRPHNRLDSKGQREGTGEGNRGRQPLRRAHQVAEKGKMTGRKGEALVPSDPPKEQASR